MRPLKWQIQYNSKKIPQFKFRLDSEHFKESDKRAGTMPALLIDFALGRRTCVDPRAARVYTQT